MTRTLVHGVWLTVVWAALWGEFTAANLIGGAVVAGGLLLLFPFERGDHPSTFRPLAFLRFVWFFVGQLVTANAQVAWEVVTPRNRDNEGILAIPVVPSCSRTVLTTIVNSIGLAPGTMVIDLTESPRVLFVHLLHLDDPEAERATLMRFQELVVRAFGSARAVAELDELLETGGRT